MKEKNQNQKIEIKGLYFTHLQKPNRVYVNGKILQLFDPFKSSGFTWGYHGEGPSSLARAILSRLSLKKSEQEDYFSVLYEIIARLQNERDFSINISLVELENGIEPNRFFFNETLRALKNYTKDNPDMRPLAEVLIFPGKLSEESQRLGFYKKVPSVSKHKQKSKELSMARIKKRLKNLVKQKK